MDSVRITKLDRSYALCIAACHMLAYANYPRAEEEPRDFWRQFSDLFIGALGEAIHARNTYRVWRPAIGRPDGGEDFPSVNGHPAENVKVVRSDANAVYFPRYIREDVLYVVYRLDDDERYMRGEGALMGWDIREETRYQAHGKGSALYRVPLDEFSSYRGIEGNESSNFVLEKGLRKYAAHR